MLPIVFYIVSQPPGALSHYSRPYEYMHAYVLPSFAALGVETGANWVLPALLCLELFFFKFHFFLSIGWLLLPLCRKQERRARPVLPLPSQRGLGLAWRHGGSITADL